MELRQPRMIFPRVRFSPGISLFYYRTQHSAPRPMGGSSACSQMRRHETRKRNKTLSEKKGSTTEKGHYGGNHREHPEALGFVKPLFIQSVGFLP